MLEEFVNFMQNMFFYKKFCFERHILNMYLKLTLVSNGGTDKGTKKQI